MKKYKRHLMQLLAVVLTVSVLPLSALAYNTVIFQESFNTRNTTFVDLSNIVDSQEINHLYNTSEGGQTISIKDYDRLIRINNKLYDFVGMGSLNDPDCPKINNGITSITIPALPDTATTEETEAWLSHYFDITLAYAPHKHHLGPWCCSPTNHWRECTVCHEIFMDWHHDYDGDGICDRCGQEIVYYKMTVLDTENGKVTVSEEKAPLNKQVDVTVEPADGYVLQELHFYKMNSARSEITRYEDSPGAKYHLITPTYDVEIQAVFVKK